MIGKTRCRLHGGKTPKGTKGNRTHGLYSKALSPAEAEAWDAVPIGDLDAEIRMCKVLLARALELDHTTSNDPSSKVGLHVAEIRESSSGDGKGRSKSKDVIVRRPDVMARINMLLGRIAQLEKTRSDLLTAAAGKPGVDVRFVVEIPPEEQPGEWLATYRGTALSPTPPVAPDPGDDEGAG
jgi:hypothetical protein